jgi:hypothetical protein
MEKVSCEESQVFGPETIRKTRGKVMIDSNSSGQEQDRMNSEDDSITSVFEYRKPNVENVLNGADADVTACITSETPKRTWFEISLGHNGLEVMYSMLSGREILDCLENDDIVTAQITAAMRRLQESILVSAPRKQVKAMKRRGSIDLRFEVEGISDADLTMEVILKALEVPDAPDMQEFTVDEVIALMADVLQYDVSALDSIEDGVGGAAIQIRQHSKSKSNVTAQNWGFLQVKLQDLEVRSMTVSDFGNFLYCIKHYGEEVALAVLASLETNENLIAEGSQSLPANSPSNDHTDSYDEAGNQNA